MTTAAPSTAVAVEFPVSTDVEEMGTVVMAGKLDGVSALLEDAELDCDAALAASALDSTAALELALLAASPRELTSSVLDAAEVTPPEAVTVAGSRTVVVDVYVLVSVC